MPPVVACKDPAVVWARRLINNLASSQSWLASTARGSTPEIVDVSVGDNGGEQQPREEEPLAYASNKRQTEAASCDNATANAAVPKGIATAEGGNKDDQIMSASMDKVVSV